jgi:hypothetical protein
LTRLGPGANCSASAGRSGLSAGWTPAGRRWRERGLLRFDGIVAGLLLAQLLLPFRVPVGYVPTAVDRAGGMRFLAELEATEGEVLMPGQGYLAGLAGKRVFAHQMPVSDYAKSGLPEAPALQQEYQEAVAARRFALIVDSNTSFVRKYVGAELLAAHYEMTGWVFPDASVFLPISGAQIRPGKIWTRREGPGSSGAEPRREARAPTE